MVKVQTCSRRITFGAEYIFAIPCSPFGACGLCVLNAALHFFVTFLVPCRLQVGMHFASLVELFFHHCACHDQRQLLMQCWMPFDFHSASIWLPFRIQIGVAKDQVHPKVRLPQLKVLHIADKELYTHDGDFAEGFCWLLYKGATNV